MSPKLLVRVSDRGLRYALFPADSAAAAPLLLYLHGARSRGADPALLLVAGTPPALAAASSVTTRSFTIVCPQLEQSARSWTDRTRRGQLLSLIDELCADASLRIDRDRILLCGASLGGEGVWALGGARPDRFAACVAVCAAADLSAVGGLRGTPVWIFHGANDTVTPVAGSDQMSAALRRAGNEEVHYTRITTCPTPVGNPHSRGHAAWMAAFDAASELWPWLLRRRRPGAPDGVGVVSVTLTEEVALTRHGEEAALRRVARLRHSAREAMGQLESVGCGPPSPMSGRLSPPASAVVVAARRAEGAEARREIAEAVAASSVAAATADTSPAVPRGRRIRTLSERRAERAAQAAALEDRREAGASEAAAADTAAAAAAEAAAAADAAVEAAAEAAAAAAVVSCSVVGAAERRSAEAEVELAAARAAAAARAKAAAEAAAAAATAEEAAQRRATQAGLALATARQAAGQAAPGSKPVSGARGGAAPVRAMPPSPTDASTAARIGTPPPGMGAEIEKEAEIEAVARQSARRRRSSRASAAASAAPPAAAAAAAAPTAPDTTPDAPGLAVHQAQERWEAGDVEGARAVLSEAFRSADSEELLVAATALASHTRPEQANPETSWSRSARSPPWRSGTSVQPVLDQPWRGGGSARGAHDSRLARPHSSPGMRGSPQEAPRTVPVIELNAARLRDVYERYANFGSPAMQSAFKSRDFVKLLREAGLFGAGFGTSRADCIFVQSCLHGPAWRAGRRPAGGGPCGRGNRARARGAARSHCSARARPRDGRRGAPLQPAGVDGHALGPRGDPLALRASGGEALRSTMDAARRNHLRLPPSASARIAGARETRMGARRANIFFHCAPNVRTAVRPPTPPRAPPSMAIYACRVVAHTREQNVRPGRRPLHTESLAVAAAAAPLIGTRHRL